MVSSLESFKTGLRPYDLKASTDPRLLRVYLAIYDTLRDDDEDVRAKGATIVSWILSTPTPPESNQPIFGDVSLSPPAAVAKLLEFICTSYRDSAELFRECISRITGISVDERTEEVTTDKSSKDLKASDHQPADPAPFPLLTPVQTLLATARKEDSSLFAQEKQNLYVDPVQEAQRWASCIHFLSPSAFQSGLAIQLEKWAVEGLECLIETAGNEVDGPLGWSSKPEVFVLGVRVLEAVKVVKAWEEKGLIGREVGGMDGLMERWRMVDVHPLWVRKMLGG